MTNTNKNNAPAARPAPKKTRWTPEDDFDCVDYSVFCDPVEAEIAVMNRLAEREQEEQRAAKRAARDAERRTENPAGLRPAQPRGEGWSL